MLCGTYFSYMYIYALYELYVGFINDIIHLLLLFYIYDKNMRDVPFF